MWVEQIFARYFRFCMIKPLSRPSPASTLRHKKARLLMEKSRRQRKKGRGSLLLSNGTAGSMAVTQQFDDPLNPPVDDEGWGTALFRTAALQHGNNQRAPRVQSMTCTHTQHALQARKLECLGGWLP